MRLQFAEGFWAENQSKTLNFFIVYSFLSETSFEFNSIFGY